MKLMARQARTPAQLDKLIVKKQKEKEMARLQAIRKGLASHLRKLGMQIAEPVGERVTRKQHRSRSGHALPLVRLLLLACLCLSVAGCAPSEPVEDRQSTRPDAKRDDAALGRLRPVHNRFWMEIISPTGEVLHLYASWDPRDVGRIPSEGQADAIFIGADGTFQVPSGQYRISRWIVEEVDGAGARWCCEGHTSNLTPPVTVRAGETTALVFGPPLEAELVQRTSQSGAVVSFSLTLRDRGGTLISSITRDDCPAEEPLIQIVNEAGVQIVTYG